MIRHLRPSRLFPYTTLFRSGHESGGVARAVGGELEADDAVSAEVAGDQVAAPVLGQVGAIDRSEEHTSELQSLRHLVCRLLLEKKKKKTHRRRTQDKQV